MNNKTTKSENVIPSHIPEDVIMEEILPRLPVKSLIRFKSVSKYWLSTISSHKFVKPHLKFSSSRLQSLIYYAPNIDEGSCFISFDECNNVKDIVQLDYNNLSSRSPNNFPQVGSGSYVIGSCNGLVCLYGSCFYIWNPAMNQCHNVSCPDFDHQFYQVSGMGFGYVSSVDDYRIGLLIRDIYSNEYLCYVYVYSLRDRTWIAMPSLDRSNENYNFRIGRRYYEGVVVDDTLYWPPLISFHKKDAHIAGLNLVNGEIKKIPLMDLSGVYSKVVRVFQMKECLSVCFSKYVNGDYSTCCVTDIWMLKHQNNWEKVMSFDFGGLDLLWLFENGKCLVRADFNERMIYHHSHDSLKQYKQGVSIWPEHKKQLYLENSIGEAQGYVESLISPFGTNLSDENQTNLSDENQDY